MSYSIILAVPLQPEPEAPLLESHSTLQSDSFSSILLLTVVISWSSVEISP